MHSDNIKKVIILSLILAIGIFYIFSIRDGHDWDGDFAMYVHHAKNIVEHAAYKDTGYIYNPFFAYCGPETYPPVFPLILSPIYKWYDLDLTAMKVEIILIFLMFLWVFFLIFEKEFPFQYVAAMITIIGLNPYFWNFKNSVLSELPFIFFFYLGLLLIYKMPQEYKSKALRIFYPVLTGFCIYLSYGTRSIGILLLGLLFYDTIRFKKPIIVAAIATCVFAFFAALQAFFLHSDTSYLKEFAISPGRTALSNLYWYVRGLPIFWDNGYSKPLRYTLFLAISMFSITGYVSRIRSKATIFEVFTLVYALLVILWPGYSGTRYLIPLVPLYIFYAFAGFKKFGLLEGRENRKKWGYILLAAIFISYVGKYARIDYGPLDYGVDKKETVELFDYIRESTRDEDVFVFQKPRILALYTGRKASSYYFPEDSEELWDYMHKIGAGYIITAKPLDENHAYLSSFITRYKTRLQELYHNPDFTIYKISERLP